ncbi:hypothetical protein Goklo_007318 [Gossypium klotzschianum]|uniref:Uncharacterized protein n=2 Tax=Gossypium TaxID=3633 RepID=A0A7J8WFA9_9ROSI|nr:hypothetical protein [Gossypium klotzschianum]
MCPDFDNDFTVTSYMCFLDLLIDEGEDVKDLRDSGILYNGLGSDEEMAKLFNKMNTDLVPSPTIYSGVKEKIHNHCKTMWINHAAQGYHTYFRSPWTFLAFLGAIAALTLSALQTYYTIHQPNLKMSSTEEGGGAAGAVSTDQTIIDNNTNNDYVGIDMRFTDVPLSDGEVAKLQSLDKAFGGGQPTLRYKPLIRKVPSTLLRNEDFKKYFKPKMISIGPLHHNDLTLRESKGLKLKLAAHFVKKIGVDKKSLYSKIKKEMDGLKECYDPQELEKYRDDNEELAWMFIVDGCAILQAVYMRYDNDDDDDDDDDDDGNLLTNNDLLTFLYSDLLLLENQLPFRVLELLTSLGDGKMFMNAIRRFIDDTVINPAENRLLVL